MIYYWSPKIRVTEGVSGFCGDRNFGLAVKSEDEILEICLEMGEPELRKLLKQIQDVLGADR